MSQCGRTGIILPKFFLLMTDVKDIVAATGITADMLYGIIRVQGSGGPITITATPNIADGINGQIIIIVGQSDVNTLTLQDEGTLPNSGLVLNGNSNMTLGQYDTIQLMYDSTADKWIEISRSSN